jgi:hypothetical protein
MSLLEERKNPELQRCLLGILKAIDQVCREHGLTYYLLAGTCLGAIRHQGFIPWDDDVDLMMPRPAIERFRQAAPVLLGTLPQTVLASAPPGAEKEGRQAVPAHLRVLREDLPDLWKKRPDVLLPGALPAPLLRKRSEQIRGRIIGGNSTVFARF